ncbi:MAG: glycosyltransferase [Acetobacteraceae bacterium]
MTYSAHSMGMPGRRPVSVAIYLHDLTGGGVERQNMALAVEFMRMGLDITVVLHRRRGALADCVPPGIRLVELNRNRTLEDIPALAGYMRRHRPDILLANFDYNNIAALMAKALAASRTQVVICQHNTLTPDAAVWRERTYRFITPAYRLLSPFLGRAIAVSHGVARELETLAHLPTRKIVTIHNPVIGDDFAERSAAEVDHPWFHDQEMRARGGRVFVTAGRMVPQKDHVTLLRAFALHRQRVPSRLLMLGAGEMHDELVALTHELGLDDAVAFLGFQNNPLPWFRRADAFVLSSRFEGFGNVLVEAMACGTAVISTDCQHGPSEILDDGRFGTLVPPEDPAALAAAMDSLDTLLARCPPDMLRARGASFSKLACAQRYREVFDSLLADRRVNA